MTGAAAAAAIVTRSRCDDQPGDDPVCVAVEDAADVRRRFALAQLHLGIEQGDRMAAEAMDGDLEGHPGAVARALEDERHRPAQQRAAEVAARPGRVCQVEDGEDLVVAEVGDAEQVAAGERGTHPTHMVAPLR